eukprot:1364306-Pyramimonas_sp.AAC.1
MEHGIDNRSYRKLLDYLSKMKQGNRLSALMLTIAVGATWPKERVREQTNAVTDGKCPRCKLKQETAFHRTWECDQHKSSPAYDATEHLVGEATAQQDMFE